MAKTMNIIFDLGGVLLNISYNKTLEAFKELGYDDFEEMYTQYTADALFEDLETGKITADGFYTRLLEGKKTGITKQQIMHAWNNMLLDFRIESLAFLTALAKDHSIYLLSNTNEIHFAAFEELFNKQTGLASLDQFFKKAYYSHKINLRKPNTDIFEFVLKDAGIKAAETIFIDDSWNNIETAKAMGFKTHLLLPGEKIEELDYTS